jgi:subtilisin family serine protease
VAVLDSGVDATHPDLQGQVLATASFVGTADAVDHNGHGTHVASLVAGTGDAAAGARRGVAYGARLLIGKVLDDTGVGTASGLIAAMQWAVDQGGRVVNMSLGTTSDGTDDPMVQAVEELSARTGALFVVAAGNAGPSEGTIQTPGIAPAALTVGAVRADDFAAFFSSRGPVRGSFRLKPDITAPGVSIAGARAGGGTTNPYTQMSGTSQATPHVAGAAALLWEEHPDWTAAQVKSTLVDTAAPRAQATVWDEGGGRLDLGRATTASLLASPATMDLGYLRWPNRDPVSRTLTLANAGDSARTVRLTDAETVGSEVAADDAMVTVTPTELTLPPHGAATATVSLSPALGDAGLYSGAITVSDGSTPLLRLPLGFYEEPERYDLHLTVIDHNGNPYAGGTAIAANLDDMSFGLYSQIQLDANGQATLRVVPGTYGVMAQVTTPGPDGGPASLALPVVPEVDAHHDVSVTLDARRTVPLRAPRVPGVRSHAVMAGVHLTLADRGRRQWFTTLDFPDAADIAAGRVLVQPVSPAEAEHLTFTTRWRLLSDPVGHRDATSVYDLFQEHPKVPNPPVSDLSGTDVARLARLDTTYNALGSAATMSEWRSGWTDTTNLSISFPQPLTVPAHRIEYATASQTVHWQQRVFLPEPADLAPFEPVRTYRPGERADVHWLRTLSPQPVSVFRTTDLFTVVLGLGDGEHAAQTFSALRSARITMSRDGQVLGSRDGAFGFFTIPAGSGRYTLSEDVQIDPDVLDRPAESHTTWSFTAPPPPQPDLVPDAIPPMLTLRHAPELDTLGHARPGYPLRLDLTVGHLTGAPAPLPQVRNATLAFSVDNGATWLPLRVSSHGSSFRAIIPGQAMRPGGSVSLRTTASDAAGATVEQTVLDLFRVGAGS